MCRDGWCGILSRSVLGGWRDEYELGGSDMVTLLYSGTGVSGQEAKGGEMGFFQSSTGAGGTSGPVSSDSGQVEGDGAQGGQTQSHADWKRE